MQLHSTIRKPARDITDRRSGKRLIGWQDRRPILVDTSMVPKIGTTTGLSSFAQEQSKLRREYLAAFNFMHAEASANAFHRFRNMLEALSSAPCSCGS